MIVADAISPLLDHSPVDVRKIFSGSLSQRIANLKSLSVLAKTGTSLRTCKEFYFDGRCFVCVGLSLGSDLPNFYELISAPASKISLT